MPASRPALALRAALAVFCTPVFATTNNLVLNGSFEQGTSSWVLFGQGMGVTYASANPAFDGTNALRASARSALSHHVAQDVTARLASEGTGAFYAIEFSVLMDAPGLARCNLQVVDGAGTNSLILAERVITTATGRWVRVLGGRTINWQGSLASAQLRFEIGQVTEKQYPPASLDRMRIVPDSDRDGLADDLDPAPSMGDANSNALPDGWEALHLLASGPGTLDSDGDGADNAHEYWAATDPTNALSRPGETANTNATPEARALLRYLAALPSLSTQRVLVGQVVTDTAPDYTSQVVRLAQQTGRWPAMLGVSYEMVSGPIDHEVITPFATNYWNDGGLVHVQWNPDNPWNGNFSGDTNNMDFPLLFTPGSAPHSNYLAMLDEVATGLHQLGDAGMTVLFRPLCECNSHDNWYEQRPRDEYIQLFRWTFDYLARSQALHHVLWVYDALAAPHGQVPVNYLYPGDDVVDVFGVNLYDDDWQPAFDLDRLSRDFPKPLAIPEGGPLTRLDGSFTNTVYMVGVTSAFPRLSYFNIYNSFVNSTQKLYGLADNIGASNLFDHPWIVTREDVAWRAFLDEYGAWQAARFTTNANRADVAAPEADADGDRLPNLIEFAIDGDPNLPSEGPIIPAGGEYTLRHNPQATGVVCQLESCADLLTAPWNVCGISTGGAIWAALNGFSLQDLGDGTTRLSPTGGAASAHIRLRVRRP